ncbi:hypothetical protein ACE1CM_05375 [Microseira sp. BLCC-F43]
MTVVGSTPRFFIWQTDAPKKPAYKVRSQVGASRSRRLRCHRVAKKPLVCSPQAGVLPTTEKCDRVTCVEQA